MGLHVLILSQMTLVLVILDDHCLFKQYSESFVFPFVTSFVTGSRNRLQCSLVEFRRIEWRPTHGGHIAAIDGYIDADVRSLAVPTDLR